jgi:hypothetical protein
MLYISVCSLDQSANLFFVHKQTKQTVHVRAPYRPSAQPTYANMCFWSDVTRFGLGHGIDCVTARQRDGLGARGQGKRGTTTIKRKRRGVRQGAVLVRGNEQG